MSEGYGTNAGFTTYHTARGRDLSDYDDGEITTARLIGSEWLDGSFRDRFPGYKVGQRAQEREWPRYGVVDREGYAVDYLTVPTEIENASYEAAYRQLHEPGSLLFDYKANKYQQVSIDGAISVRYNNYASALDAQTQFPIIGQILDPLLGGESFAFSGKVVRA